MATVGVIWDKNEVLSGIRMLFIVKTMNSNNKIRMLYRIT